MKRLSLASARCRMATATAAVILAVVLLAGCGSDTNGPTSPTGESGPTNTAKPKKGGTLQVADFSEAITLTPATAIDNSGIHVLSQIMEPLFRTLGNGKVISWLATSASHSADAHEWTIKIRQGVKFSNGQPMTVKDVLFSLEAARKSPNWLSLFEGIESIKAGPGDTVVIRTKKPNLQLPYTLSIFSAGIVPANYGGLSAEEFGEHPVGTGPFMLRSWKPGETLTLVRNPKYWKSGLPVLDEVVFHNVTQDTSRASQLLNGSLDLIAQPAWAQISSLEHTPEINVGIYAQAYSDFLEFNEREPLFQNPKVLEAVNLAVDREGIVKAATQGYGQPSGSFFTPDILYYDSSLKPQSQELAKAKALLSEAVAEGVKPRFSLLYANEETYWGTAAQVIQQNLEEIGFEVTLQTLDGSTMLSDLGSGKFDMNLIALTTDILDPSEFGSLYLSVLGPWMGAEFTERIKHLVPAAAGETNKGKQQELYAQIQKQINREHHLVTLDYRPFVWAMHESVAGFEISPTGIPWLAEVGFAES